MNQSQRPKRRRIAIFATNPPHTYSGGRYHSFMMALALANSGHRVHYVTNHAPIFLDDLSIYPCFEKVTLNPTPDFVLGLPGGPFDLVVLVPGTQWTGFYNRTQRFALERRAHLVFLNFESGNWFNELSPIGRDLSHWDRWKAACKNASLILSISAEGNRYAKAFYKKIPRACHFDYVYPSINTLAADSIQDAAPENRIFVMTRFGKDDHKGGANLSHIITDALRGHTLVLLLGTGDIPAEIRRELDERAQQHGVAIELKYKLSDIEKFREIKRSRLLLFPSYFEGYGYPPVEAQYCNVPCVAFDLPVLRETCPGGVTFAQHGDWNDFREKVEGALRLDGPNPEFHDQILSIATLEAQSERLETVLAPLDAMPKPSPPHRWLKRLILQMEIAIRERHWKPFLKRNVKRLALLITAPLRYGVRRYRRKRQGIKTVCYWPPFSDPAELTSHYYRACWYLPRVEGACERVLLYRSRDQGDSAPGERPASMGRAPRDCSHVEIKTGRLGLLGALLRADLVLIWKNEQRGLVRYFLEFSGVKTIDVDTHSLAAKEYGAYCSLIWKWLLGDEEKERIRAEHRRRFREIHHQLSARGFQRACVFGTGPSLEKAMDFDFGGALTIACNTIVQNGKLLDHIEPKFICAGDVISHFGVSAYAERFRADLIEALKTRDLYFFGTLTFGYLLSVNHPEIRDKMILIEQLSKEPNYDLMQYYAAPQLDSTLNIHMLPLAATFAKEVWLLGCDGKSMNRSNEDFWAHAEQAQYHDLVRTGHECHPTFDEHRRQSTYDRYVQSTGQTILTGERKHGIRYWSLAPSNIPILATRSLSESWLKEHSRSRPYRLEELSRMASPVRNGI